MTIEPKMMSAESLDVIKDYAERGMGYSGDACRLLAHIAAQAEQIAAKDAEINRLRAFVDRVAFASISEISRDLREEARVSLTYQPKEQSHG